MTTEEIFPHDEYHFYITDHNNEPRHIHLPESVVQDARELLDTDLPVGDDWLPKFWHDLGNEMSTQSGRVYFCFYPTDPSLSEFYHCPTRGESKRIFGSVFKKPVWFDGSFLGASTGPPADKEQHHYREIRENTVLPEHRDQYMDRLIEYEENAGWETGWIDR